MDHELQKVINASTYNVEEGIFRYAQMKEPPNSEKVFMITRDADEVTVIAKDEIIGSLNTIEVNKEKYALISLNVSVPFYSVGFLATVSSAIAKEDMNVLIVSTYSKDYILVKHDQLDRTKKILDALGFLQNKV